MTWPALVLLVAAAGLSAAGAVAASEGRDVAVVEARARRAIVGLELMAASLALAVIAGALLAAGGTAREQSVALVAVVSAFALPQVVVRLARGGRGSRRKRRAAWEQARSRVRG